MTVIHPKNLSRLIAPSAMVLSLLLPVEGQAGFQWITPLEQTPIATQPAPDEKTPIASKKELPPAVQLPALEPVLTAPSDALPSVVGDKPAMTETTPVILTPAIVDHDAAAASPGQPTMDVVSPGAAPAPVSVLETTATPVAAEASVPVSAPEPVLEEKPQPVPEPAPLALPEPEPAPVMEPKAEVTDPATVTPLEVVKPASAMEPVPSAPVMAVPVVSESQEASVTVLQAQKPVDARDDGALIKGFGKDLPLVLVLKQILPKDHVFAFESGVDPAIKANWRGGKGWRVVLSETLQPLGLTAHEDGSLVSIVRAESAPVAMTRDDTPVMAAPSSTAPVVDSTPLQQPEPVMPAAVVEPIKESVVSPNIDPVTLTAPEPVVVAPEAVPTVGKVVMPPATLEPPLLPGLSDVWQAEAGEQLRGVIKRWCARAKVELVWSSEYDYPIQAGVSLTGSFEEAVRNLLSGFVDAKPQPFARLHDNPAAGQRTLVVQSRGNTNGE